MKYMFIQNQTKLHRFQKAIYLLIVILMIAWAVWISAPGDGVIWPSPLTSHSSSESEIWSLSNIYMNTNLQPLITAFDYKLVILGSDDVSREANVIAFDANTGNIPWRAMLNGISISSVSSKVIVGGRW